MTYSISDRIRKSLGTICSKKKNVTDPRRKIAATRMPHTLPKRKYDNKRVLKALQLTYINSTLMGLGA